MGSIVAIRIFDFPLYPKFQTAIIFYKIKMIRMHF